MDSLILIIILFAIIFFWWDSVGVKEKARETGHQYCRQAEVQFLDDTVELVRLRVRRNYRGQLCFYRTYRFEFSSTGAARFQGMIYMLGRVSDKVQMQAYPTV
ncbi:hypothetical protein MNBD_GAMMA24-2406 [hydrothermal vent metagenome]|uniref:DUF3301 domain-containing protein n=1 Tax=hydrothermal vent metagenome TaxID=652676 RepID=A0A3B1C136_9ZZZZ